MTRAEHLAWAKARAREYLADDDLATAVVSFVSDCNKHPDIVLSQEYLHHGVDLSVARDGVGVRALIEDII